MVKPSNKGRQQEWKTAEQWNFLGHRTKGKVFNGAIGLIRMSIDIKENRQAKRGGSIWPKTKTGWISRLRMGRRYLFRNNPLLPAAHTFFGYPALLMWAPLLPITLVPPKLWQSHISPNYRNPFVSIHADLSLFSWLFIFLSIDRRIRDIPFGHD